MEKLLKMEKYQFLHNFVYWCGIIGIFVLGFFYRRYLCARSYGTGRRKGIFPCRYF